MSKELIIIFTGTLGTLGFALIFQLKRNRLAYATFGGFITCIAYVISTKYFSDDFLMNLFPTMIAVIYSEIMARVKKAPVTIFMIPSLVPLIPGGMLYRTMNYAILGQQDKMGICGISTLKIAMSIAVGIVGVSTICKHLFNAKVTKNGNE